MITDPPPTDSTIVPAPRKKLDSEFSEEENKLEMADTQAEIILSQGLPRHIFNNLNQTSTAKEIWDNVEMLMQGSAVNDYEDYSAQHSSSSDETKVCQHLSALGEKYVTNVKQNMDISPHLMFRSLLILKASQALVGGVRAHAKCSQETEQSTSIVESNGYVAHTSTAPVLPSQYNFKSSTTVMLVITGARGNEGDMFTNTEEEGRVVGSVKNQEKDGLSVLQRFKSLLWKQKPIRRMHDSNVDEGPNADCRFQWPNLSSQWATNNPVNEYLLDTEAQNVPTEVSADTSDKVSMIVILTDLQTQLDGHAKVNQEKCFGNRDLNKEFFNASKKYVV
ncbi:hypothetical protein Tco_1132164 [Tanacetum coccineum]|uniref:Uncharacterized protein n=1 Tax=Tanacetum coccineum TaxID=301880 RepID=A0ABQ5JE78_9ASTR